MKSRHSKTNVLSIHMNERINPNLKTQDALVDSSNFNKFMVPFRMCLTGPSMSGKSYFIERLLQYRDDLFSSKFSEIYYCLPPEGQHTQDNYLEKLQRIVPDIILIYGVPKHEDVFSHTLPKLFIFDDMVSLF